MYKRTVFLGLFLVLALGLIFGFCVSLCFAQENLTITTYYPSPYGSYRELRSQRMAIGDTYNNISTVCWGATCGGATVIPDAADLVVEGSVGIGTASPSPGIKLQIEDAVNNAGVVFSRGGTIIGGILANTSNQLNVQANNQPLRFSADGFVTEHMRITPAGNVGIGTASPGAKLQVEGNSYLLGGGRKIYGNADPANYYISNYAVTGSDGLDIHWYGGIRLFDGTGTGLQVTNGNVGIGTTNPTATLHVNGNIKAVLNDIDGAAPANMRYNSGTNVIGYDIAELFESNEEVEPADVLTIAENGKLQKSNKAYDTAVVGIVSEAPAILFEGSQLQIAPKPFAFKTGKKPPLALAGRVFCKVTTSKGGPIKRGDLLVTSSKPGYAMKGDPKKIQIGTVLGKALEPLEKGEGKITVLVTLQ